MQTIKAQDTSHHYVTINTIHTNANLVLKPAPLSTTTDTTAGKEQVRQITVPRSSTPAKITPAGINNTLPGNKGANEPER